MLIFLLYFFSCRMRIHWRHPKGFCQWILILSCYLLSMLLGGHLFRSLCYIFILIYLFASFIAYIWVAFSQKNIASIFASSLKGFAHIPAIFFLLYRMHIHRHYAPLHAYSLLLPTRMLLGGHLYTISYIHALLHSGIINKTCQVS